MSLNEQEDVEFLKRRLAELENEKEQLLQQLHANQTQFLLHTCQTFERLDEGVAILDQNLTFVYWTKKFEANTRITELFQGLHISDTKLHSQFGNLHEISKQFLHESYPKKLQWEANVADWDKWFRITISRLSTPPTISATFILLRITDITHCKHAELERNYLKTELSCLFEHLPMGLAVFDPGFKYRKINNMLANQNGKSIEEHVGKTVFEVLPEFLAVPVSLMVKQVVDTGIPVLDLQVTGIPKDDNVEHTYLCNYAPVFEEVIVEENSPKEELIDLHRFGTLTPNATKIYGVVMTVVDITHFKNKEKQLIQENNRVQQGTVSKTRFLATVSHELRTPLTCILGMVDCLLEDSELSNEQLDCVQSINRSAHSMLQVLNDVLDLTKVEAGKLQLEHKKFDLLLEIEMATDVLSFRAAQKNLELILHFDLSMPRYFVGDPGRIRQVLMNVAGNAVKFTEAGHVTIEVLTGNQTNRNNNNSCKPPEFFRTDDHILDCNNRTTIIIRVTDSGIGIPLAKQDQLFEEFKQLEISQSGTGLGLAISKQLAFLMHGDVYLVSSVPGMGSVFEISLSLETSNSPFSLQSSSSSLGVEITQSALDKPQSQTALLKSPSVSPSFPKKERQTFYHTLTHEPPEDFYSLITEHQSRSTVISTLLICKHEKWRSIIRSYLEHWKCFVVDCCASEDNNLFLDKLKTSTVDLFIADCNAIEEYEAMQKLLSDQTASLWIVAPTSRPLVSQLAKKFEGTRSRYITRPILPSSLMDCLFGLLTNRKIQHKRNFSEATTHKTFPNIRVLLVEDNLLNQKIILRMLQKLACEADVAENGKEAIEKWRNRKYDIIFMDCQMPIMNGWDATRAIRAMEKSKGSHTPIVALTARALSTDRATCLETGMDEFLSKPLQQDKVEEILSQFCDMRPVKRRKSMDVQE